MIEIILPAMGEGIIEAEITRWLVREGKQVEADEPVVEVATDKVDSEIPSPGSGIIHKILLEEGDTAKVGQVLAIIATKEDAGIKADAPVLKTPEPGNASPPVEKPAATPSAMIFPDVAFLSPVIRKIARENELSPAEIQGIRGSGIRGRITKADVEAYLASRSPAWKTAGDAPGDRSETMSTEKQTAGTGRPVPGRGVKESPVEEMDRMRKLIADHMVYSMKVAPHVTSFVESDVTEMILWRNRVREEFEKKYKQKLTITTLIMEAVIKTLKEHPRINVSVDGYKIIRKQEINPGMATALPDGNLIVPVIHHADTLNLPGLSAKVNDLAERARAGKLLPADIQGGTFTVTNMGQFGNIAGTPIINQPQVAILAVGAIVKKPAVVETPEGDAIGIRHMLILSLAYDHRVVDGALGGTFLKSIGDYLQGFDSERII